MLYTADLLQLIKCHRLCPHAYADDTQIYGFCQPSTSTDLVDRVSACVADVSNWMGSNRLLLNPTKTEVLWCSSRRRQHLLPTGIIRINNTLVTPVSSVSNLVVHIECDTAMKNHVTTVVRSCFAALRQIRSVRRSLSRHALITLIRALVVSKVDYCNSVLAGVLNAAARLIFSA